MPEASRAPSVTHAPTRPTEGSLEGHPELHPSPVHLSVRSLPAGGVARVGHSSIDMSGGNDGGDVLAEAHCSAGALLLCRPHPSRDVAMHALLNDAPTMLPHLSMLCPISHDDSTARRVRHRTEAATGTSCMLDVVLGETGELIGSTGFRVVEHGASSAEWGIIVSKAWQRKGVCAACFTACLGVATSALNVRNLTASTIAENESMLAFFKRRGVPQTGVHTDGETGVEWLVFGAPLDNLASGSVL